MPSGLKFSAVGQGTGSASRNFGIHSVIVPTIRFDSEALLDMAELKQVGRQAAWSFSVATAGASCLADTLIERGAKLEYAECYRRAKPVADIAPLLKAWATGQMNAITMTSSEGLAQFI